MDLRQIRYFVAIAESGSMLAAAKRLHVAQPALSRRLADLERSLCSTLVLRHGRGVTLTDQGSRFLAHCRDILAAVGRAEADFGIRSTIASGRPLIFGVTPTASTRFMPQIVAACAALSPSQKLIVRQGSTPELVDLLTRGGADIALTFARPDEDGLEIIPLYTDELALLGRPEVIGEAAPVPLNVLGNFALVLPPASNVGRQMIDSAIRVAGVTMDVRAEIEPATMQLQMMLTQEIAVVGMRSTFLRELETGALVARPIVQPDMVQTLHLALQKKLPAATRKMIRGVVQEVVAETVLATNHDGWIALL